MACRPDNRLPRPGRSPAALALVLALSTLGGAAERDAHHLLVPVQEQLPTWQQVSLLYGAQWCYYAAGQGDNIRRNGSVSGWGGNVLSPHFDKDFYDYNLVFHTMAGSGYYGYYRSFGSTRLRSFALSSLSVLLFEFTIESLTERTSYQDIYQTPVLGSLLGMGLEDLSLLCLGSDWAPVRGLGYVFNPFTLFPGSAWQVTIDRGTPNGARVAIPF